jgi:hypothetical protein
MNGAHLHLLMNHGPVVGSVFAALLMAWMVARGSADGRRVALAGLLVVALASLPAYFSGEPAEDAVEHQPGIEQRRIETHEGAAKVALVGALVTGAFALAGLVRFRRREPAMGFLFVALGLNLASVGLFARAASLGGEIRHPEIRAGAPAAPGAAQGAEADGDHD